MDVTDSSGSLCAPDNAIPKYACPTGQMTVTDNGSPLDLGTYALNSHGYAEDWIVQLTTGAHPITANYGGDQNYDASAASQPLTITPAPGD